MADYKNVQKGQYKELMAKVCSACGTAGFNRTSCPNKQTYCHSYTNECCDKQHLVGDKKFPCGSTCDICHGSGHTVNTCKSKCKRCTTQDDHVYGDEKYDCGRKCYMCEQTGHTPDNCKSRCRARYCSEQVHKFQDLAFPCGKSECSICRRTNHSAEDCKLKCRLCKPKSDNKPPHAYMADTYPCSKPCAKCNKKGHTDDNCRNICRAKWCQGSANIPEHIFRSAGNMCGQACFYCGKIGHDSVKCNTLCRSEACSDSLVHIFKNPYYNCGQQLAMQPATLANVYY
jgi:hypothetical protein